MKIAVVVANGKAARKIISEAVNRGMEVTAFGRRDNNTEAQHYVKKDIFDLTKEDLTGEEFTVNSKGESVISYADYAIAMVDEIEKGNHIRQRISVLGK